MFHSSSKNNNKIWQNLISSRNVPNYFTELIDIEFDYFKRKISEDNFEYQKNLINKIFAGAIIQLKNCLN